MHWIFFNFIHFYVHRCFACVYVSELYLCGPHEDQKRASANLGLELLRLREAMWILLDLQEGQLVPLITKAFLQP